MILRSTFASFRLALTLLVPAGVLGLAGTAQAQIPIALAGSDGNASTQTATYGITPSAGIQQSLLTTINPAGSLPGDGSLGTTSADTNVTTLNSYFGLPTGMLASLNAQDGSGYLSMAVPLTLGTTVSFDYVFLTNEDNTLPTTPAPSQFHNDQAFFTVNGAYNALASAGGLSAAQLNNGSNSANFDFQSLGTAGNGYTRVSYTVPATGTYTFGFGVIDVDTNTIASGLLIDNFNSVVPEPGTWAMISLGALLLVVTFRRRTA